MRGLQAQPAQKCSDNGSSFPVPTSATKPVTIIANSEISKYRSIPDCNGSGCSGARVETDAGMLCCSHYRQAFEFLCVSGSESAVSRMLLSNGSGVGSRATQSRQPRQVRKEATVTGSCVCSGFPGVWLFYILSFSQVAKRRQKPSQVPGVNDLKALHEAKITALGIYLPPRLLTNQDLEKMVDTTNDWILERTGIRGAPHRRQRGCQL